MQSNLPMKDFVINLLKDKLPKSYLYHNHEHTLYVLEKQKKSAEMRDVQKENWNYWKRLPYGMTPAIRKHIRITKKKAVCSHGNIYRNLASQPLILIKFAV